MNKTLFCGLVCFFLIVSVAFPVQATHADADRDPDDSQSPTTFSCSSVAEIPQAECEALVAQYNSTNGPNWANHTNWLETNTPSNWYGVTVEGGHVIHLVLNDNLLSGTIPHELGGLVNVQWLILSNNQLTDGIPLELGNLVNLRVLLLDNNQLTGGIPPELGNLLLLSRLVLQGNQLTGSIPSELGSLTNLEILTLDNNQLSGNIPSEFGNLTRLQWLWLGDNQLNGSLPAELGNLTNVQLLYLHNNQLSGSIPSALGNLANLTRIMLHNNQFSGSIPPELGNLTNLQLLRISNNQLTGSIPPALGNMTSLQELWLSYNQLTGSIPVELGNLVNLTYLTLESNSITGSIPPELGNLSNLTCFNLSRNLLTGNIPPELGGPANLLLLFLDRNQLTGSIPPELSGLAKLQDLRLDNNQLSGGIPPELGNLANLLGLSLGYNQLSGGIPPELGNLANLQRLYLGYNQLTGSIPPELGSLANLYGIDLSKNQLSGGIPPELGSLPNLRWLALDDNPLTGSIPSELGNLSKLEYLSLFNNQLSGEIPSQLGNLTNLEVLWLQNNQLSGDVPTSFTNLTNLVGIGQAYLGRDGLDLDYNHLNVPDGYPVAGNALHTFLVSKDPNWHLRQNITGSISGHVYQQDGVTPIANAYVKVMASDFNFITSVTSQADGAYRFDGLEQGDYYLAANADGYGTVYYPNGYDDPHAVAVTVTPPNDTPNINFSLSPEATISGFVYQSDGATPIQNATISVWPQAGGTVLSGFTDASGAYTIHKLATGVYVAKAEAGGFETEFYLNAPDWGSATPIAVTQPNNTPGIDFTLSLPLPPPLAEKQALEALYNSTNGDQWTNKNGWMVDANACNWYGITCHDGHVVTISLYNNNLSGIIPPELGGLAKLLWLSLGRNKLTGSIPSELGSLANLNRMSLNSNQLTGSIPSELGSLANLQRLYLGDNQLTGNIPPELGNLANLFVLSLHINQLTGSIPSELGNLANLQWLYLYNNQLSGSIPSELGNLANLQGLWLNNNQLSGDIPASFTNLTQLLEIGQGWDGGDGLDLDFNQLNVPAGYPVAGNDLHTFLVSKDPNWHLRQGIVISLEPTALATLVFTDTWGTTTTIQIPTGAVTTTTLLVYTHVPTITQTAGFIFAGRAFDLNAYRDGKLLAGFVFEKAVTIMIEYRDVDISGLDENTLILQWWNPNTSAWEDAACGAYDRRPAENWFSAPVCHLSHFATFAERLQNNNWIYLPVVVR